MHLLEKRDFDMRLFLFKILFRLTWWIAPNKPRVNKIFDLYLEYIEAEETFARCRRMQAEKDACIRPRTETYEHLTCEKQREAFRASMPPRIEDHASRIHYSDYDEAQAYHENKLNKYYIKYKCSEKP